MIAAMQYWGPLFLAAISAAGVLAFWIIQTANHDARLEKIPIRVHVNGIRGKSTIVRYLAAAFREGGIETLAKTTGSAARLILPDGSEQPISRMGAPTIIEQIDVLRQAAGPSTQAIVFECMALRTEYQRVSEERMIRSTDGVIANIRRDHVEQLGTSLPEIAHSLSNTAPARAPLFTAEQDSTLLDILARHAEEEGGWLVPVTGDSLSKEDLRGFSPLSFPGNIAIALEIAVRHGVAREVALRGMRNSTPDPGASKIHRHDAGGRDLYWINLFGVNDVDSAEVNIARIADWIGDRGEIVFVLNNREDREHRTLEFAEMAARNDVAAKLFLTGENLVPLREAIMKKGARNEVETLDVSEAFDPAELSDLVATAEGDAIILVGLANIHTGDALRLMDSLETEDSVWTPAGDDPSTSPAVA